MKPYQVDIRLINRFLTYSSFQLIIIIPYSLLSKIILTSFTSQNPSEAKIKYLSLGRILCNFISGIAIKPD